MSTLRSEELLKRPVKAFTSDAEPAVAAIIRFGHENRIPIGLVVDDRLCLTRMHGFAVDGLATDAAIAKLVRSLHSYRWQFEDGVVVLTPEKISAAAARFLALALPKYRIAEDTLYGQLAWAWFDINAALDPSRGTAASILSNSEQLRWPPLDVDGFTVQQLLNRLVARRSGGAWVLYPFADFDKVADEAPIRVWDYTEKQISLQQSLQRCVDSQGP